jgi:hypothetical protein
MLRPVVVIALLLTVVGSEAELLRGIRREHPREQIRKLMMDKTTKGGDGENRADPISEPPLPGPTEAASPPATQAPPNTGSVATSSGTCQCKILCQQCYKQGVNNEQCESACVYAKSENCVELCSAFFQGLEIRDDTNSTNPSLPPDTTKAPQTGTTSPPTTKAPTTAATSPPTGSCKCAILCQQCFKLGIGTSTAPCQSACDIAKDPNCEDLCSDFLEGLNSNRDDTGTLPPLPDDTVCLCVGLCEQCKAQGSGTADCKTVCNFAALSNDECTTKCNEALHIGEP